MDQKRTTLRERHPVPWEVCDMPGGFRIAAASGATIAWVYVGDERVRRANPNVTYLDRGEALAIAKAIARLPEMMP